MTRKPEGRHRVSELPLSEAGPLALPADDPGSATVEPRSRFAVHLLDGHWFIGLPDAMQRIESPEWLDEWLAANGSNGHDIFDFAGDRDLERRFLADLSAGNGAADSAVV